MILRPDSEHIDFLSGFLMTSSQINVSADWVAIIQSAGCRMKKKMAGDGWLLFEYQSNEPLLRDDEDRTPPFIYKIVVRVSGKKALILSPSRKVVNHLISLSIGSQHRKHLNKIFIDTDSLVNHFTDNPDKYLLTLVHSRVNAFGDALSSMSFYGNDISSACIFREYRELFTVFTCGIRVVSSPEELMLIGNNGFISFSYLKSDNGSAIDSALGYISDHGFMRLS